MYISQEETLHLDIESIRSLYRNVGSRQAEETISGVVMNLAEAVAVLDELGLTPLMNPTGETELRCLLYAIISYCKKIGLPDLARMAQNVIGSLNGRNQTAIAATLMRLRRAVEPFESPDTLPRCLPI